MVKDVGELHGEGGAYTFGEFEVLGQSRVNVPPIQATEITNTAATGIYPENASSELPDSGARVGEIINLARVVCSGTYGYAIYGRGRACNAKVGCGMIG